MKPYDKIGLMGTLVAALILMSCAETPKRPAPPPPSPQPASRPMATQDRPMAAQEKPADDMELIREKVRADKKLLVSMNMEMTEAEAQKFWPVYDRYQVALDRIIDRDLEIIQTFAKNYEMMSDGVAKQLLDDFLTLEDDLLALKRAYLPKFREVLTERKVARYYQIENKIEAIYNLDLAANIPLVE